MHGAALEAELDIVERDHAGEFLADVLDLEQVVGVGDGAAVAGRPAIVVGARSCRSSSTGSARRARRGGALRGAAAGRIEAGQFLVTYWSMLAGVTSSNGM